MNNLLELIAKAQKLKIELEELRPIKKSDEQRLWQKFRLEWNYNSNHIEGNTLTYGETMLLLIKEKTTGDHDVREYDEMRAHDVAVEFVRKWAQEEDRPISEADIRELNRITLVRPFWKEAITREGIPTRKKIVPGEYKKDPNHVLLPNGETFFYAEPEEVPRLMQELIEWYRNDIEDLSAPEVAALLHYRFVRIHPFDDCNGRVSRLLMNYHLLKEGYPPVIIKSADKTNYLTALNKADAGDLSAFVKYVTEQLLWSFDLNLKAARCESIEEDEDWKKQVSVLKKEAKSNKKKVVEKSNELVLTRYEDSFLPLIEKLEKELGEQFDGLFNKNEKKSTLGNRVITFAKSNSQKIKELLDSDSVNSFGWNASWIGFLNNGSDVFNIHIDIRIEFNEYTYKINLINIRNDLSSKLYTEKISNFEIQKIVNLLGKTIFEQIESRISNK